MNMFWEFAVTQALLGFFRDIRLSNTAFSQKWQVRGLKNIGTFSKTSQEIADDIFLMSEETESKNLFSIKSYRLLKINKVDFGPSQAQVVKISLNPGASQKSFH